MTKDELKGPEWNMSLKKCKQELHFAQTDNARLRKELEDAKKDAAELREALTVVRTQADALAKSLGYTYSSWLQIVGNNGYFMEFRLHKRKV